MTADPPDPLLGTLVGGRWLVKTKLTAGGMGAVYVADHVNTGRQVALKVIKSEEATKPEFVQRFRKETRALASISHPNVVTFLDSGIEHGSLYLVMELLSGRELRADMRQPVPWARAFRIAADICRGLAAVHKAGLIHRDLKPENVFLQDSEGHADFAKLIDFGIVRVEDTGTGGGTGLAVPAAGQTGGVVGTPGYISPEQLGGKQATQTSDVYAVGVILYELVTGVFPFQAPNVNAMLVKQLIDPVTPPGNIVQLPAHVDALIRRLIERDPDLRPASASEALRLLLEASSSTSPPAPAPAPSTGPLVTRDTVKTPQTVLPLSPPAPARPLRPVGAILSIVVVGLLGTAVASGIWSPWRSEPAAVEAKAATAAVVVVPPAVPATMVFIPAGEWVIGRAGGEPIDGPPHRVTLGAFAIDQYEVSIADMRGFIAAGGAAAAGIKAPPKLRAALEDRPMVHIEQRDAEAFCRFRGARLPSEEEWEAAARGPGSSGTPAPGRLYPWGDDWRPDCAQVGLGEDGVLVGRDGKWSCGQTPGGVAHLAGNAAEWTSTPASAYVGSTASDVVDPAFFVVRGGSYASVTADVTTSRRRFAGAASSDLGFRCAQSF
ncbi:MAG: bifunctional serine/threonine-protein kinase/formylglycine-generating enzyme family protein [Deltaproteobacteria bacterium]|nr:bifunctional serine/threonine-protein kinase/formylglycine-generating enzyme family protein [Deltaproteobacteria bacterium]